MSLWEARFVRFDRTVTLDLDVWSAPPDVAEAAAEIAWADWLWECSADAPWRVEVHCLDNGDRAECSVSVRSVPSFFAATLQYGPAEPRRLP